MADKVNDCDQFNKSIENSYCLLPAQFIRRKTSKKDKTEIFNQCSDIAWNMIDGNLQTWAALASEINNSDAFREQINNYLKNNKKSFRVTIEFYIPFEKIDFVGGGILQRMVNERLICDTAMSYLSTLGGAFSALGDYISQCAEKAGEISLKQFKIAIRLGEEPLAARCRLYLALSLIQQGRLKEAKRLILSQEEIAKKYHDARLANMCKGVWAKLQYVTESNSKRKQNLESFQDDM